MEGFGNNLPVLYNGGLPTEIKKIKKPWFNKKIQKIKWNDFFEVEQNKMKVFKITPHLNCSNNQNRHLWSTLHKAYELYHSTNSRTTLKVSNGLKITHREKDLIWFDILFKTDGEEKKIEFYFSTTETMAKKFKMILENRLHITCEDAALVDIGVPEENTLVNELRYVKHDIFSLDTNHNTQTTPIGSILNVVDEMESGDFARISICNEREDRKKWFNNAVWVNKKIKKGITPNRPNISGKRILDGSKPIIAGFVNEVGSIVTETLQAVSNVFSKDDKQMEKKPIIEIEKTFDAATIKNKDKVNSSVWKTHIRTAVHSPVKFNRDNISNSITSAYQEMSGDNELQNKTIRDTIHIKIGSLEIKIKGRKSEVLNELNELKISKRTKLDPNVNVVSSDEMGKLVQLPTAELQRKFDEVLKTKKNVETDIPSIFRKKGLLVGHSEVKGQEFPIYLPTDKPDEFYKGYVFQGQMGVGKDVGLQNFMAEGCLNHGISFVVIDQVNKEGREGLANGIRDSLPADKIIDLDLSGDNYLPPLDLTEVMAKLGRKGADRFANELIEFMTLEDMGQSRKILRDFAKASKGSIYLLNELLTNENYRVARIEELKDEGLLRVAEGLERFKEQKTLDSKASSIINRLDEMLGDDGLYSMFAQPPKKEMNLEQWIREGKVIIFRVPDRILSTVAVRTLVHWITLKVLMTRLLMSNEEQANGCFIVFNEPQTYMNDGLMNLMSRIAVQGRKERLGSLFAFHHIGQLPKQLADDLLAGGINQFLFKNDKKEVFEKVETSLRPTFDIETAMSIERFHAINLMSFGGRKQPAFLVKMLGPCYDRYQAYNNEFLTKRHGHMYGRSIEEIEKELVQISI